MKRWAIFLLAAVLPCLAYGAWWSPDWTVRKELGVDTTATGANTQTALTEVPVLVRLHLGNFPQFLNVRDNGADIRFVAGDDLQPLKYHVERFDPIAELAFVWVKVPVINPQSGTNKVFLYFGNQTAPRGDEAGATYDVNTVAAFHFNESTGQPLDSTAYGTQITGAYAPLPAALIGSGAMLSGAATLTVVDAPQLAGSAATGWTLSLWARLPALPTDEAVLIERANPADPAAGRFALSVIGSQLRTTLNDVAFDAGTQLVAGQWHHIAVILGNGQLATYIDGKPAGIYVNGSPVSAASTAASIPAGPLSIGGALDGTRLIGAEIDELQISNIARTPDWIAFTSAVQGPLNDQVLRYGMDETAEGAGAAAKPAGHFSIIFQNVFGRKDALVEQLVIGACGLMMLIAIVIMFLKTIDLSRATKSSGKFLKAYANLSGDQIEALYEGRRVFGDSSLWRVYRLGIDEIRKRRLSPSVGAQAAGLEPKAMASIRAAMDALMVREGQRLNSKLVLLTIAISGGPFIGLLGTVVGVMVTFAAIAATGDVNIAAIAPGMAAALLATVAGLGVAIPSLFGYNYLGSRAKELSADMHVFADELEARFNEMYGA